jgi:hypothetical protein
MTGDTVCHLHQTTASLHVEEFSLLHLIHLSPVFLSSARAEFEEPDRSGAVEEKKIWPDSCIETHRVQQTLQTLVLRQRDRLYYCRWLATTWE